MSSTVREDVQAPQKGFMGVSTPRKEDRRLVQGQGVFVDDVKRHGMGYVWFVRSPYAHAKIRSVDVSKALEAPGVYGTLTGDEVAILTDPFFQISSPPGSNVKDYALAVGKARFVGEPVVAVVAETRELARDAGELVEIEYEPLPVVTDARNAQDDDAPVVHDEAGGNLAWHGRLRLGRHRGRARGRGPRRADRRAPLRPLQLDAARARRRGGRVQPRHRAVDDPVQQPVPGLRDHHDGPGDAGRARQAPLRLAGHRRRVRQQDHLAPAPRRVLPPRAEARPPGQLDRVADRLPPEHVARERALVPGRRGRREVRRHAARLPREGARRRGRVPPLRAARRGDLVAGHARVLPLAEHPARLHAGDDEQGAGARRTAATRGCSTSGSPSGSSTSSRTSSGSTRSRSASATTSRPRRCRTRRRTAASTTPATTRRASTSRST